MKATTKMKKIPKKTTSKVKMKPKDEEYLKNEYSKIEDKPKISMALKRETNPNHMTQASSTVIVLVYLRVNYNSDFLKIENAPWVKITDLKL